MPRAAAAASDTAALEQEVASARSELGVVIAELDRRRRRAMELPHRVAQQLLPWAALALAAGAGLGGALALALYGRHPNQHSSRKRRALKGARDRARQSLALAKRAPETRPWMRIFTTAAGAAAGALARIAVARFADRAVRGTPPNTLIAET